MPSLRRRALLCAASCIVSIAAAQTPQRHARFLVQAPATLSTPVSGRLLLFLKQGSGDKEVDTSPFQPTSTWVWALEVSNLRAGATVELDPDADPGIPAFPSAFAAIPPGDYEVQAVLDVDHTYNYSGRGPQDWISPVLSIPHWTAGEGPEPTLQLAEHPAENPGRSAALTKALRQAVPGVAQLEQFESPALTRFWGRPTRIRAWVILPPGYAEHPKDRYPTVYWTHGFGGDIHGALLSGLRFRQSMTEGKMPPMIAVMMDESCSQGTHEFADSANNGPWGTALTTEFIPSLERTYRMDARPSGRLLNGHSSGGWATLQLQINYPEVFGGTWSTAPDPSDFHNFTNTDLYAPNANVYHSAGGAPTPLVRDKGKVIATFQQFAQLEQVIGPYGGQMASFEWVFSPKSDSGAPMQLFNRTTGAVDPQVMQYWHDHYDLANLAETTWPQRHSLLQGRIHLYVGTADTFYLDGSAHLLQARLEKLGAEAHFTFIPNRTHMDLYQVGEDRGALFNQIAAEMYATARPDAHWKPTTPPPVPTATSPK